MHVTIRPLSTWPYPDTTSRRSRSTFKADWNSTVNLLAREIEMLGGEGVLVGVQVPESDITISGSLRANSRGPSHPGLEVSFDSEHGRLVYATDVCEHWRHNVRSIALGLQALRAVDRYGISRKGEQYAGWAALPPAVPMLGSTMSPEEAVKFIYEHAPEYHPGTWGADLDKLREGWSFNVTLGPQYRAAAQKLHPDRGGNRDLWDRLEVAKRVLEGLGS